MINLLFSLFILHSAYSQENVQRREEFLKQDSYFDQLESVTRKGRHKYTVSQSKINATISMKLGLIRPPEFDSIYEYETIYNFERNILFMLNYDKKLVKKIGHLSVTLGSGLMFSSGNGRFSDTSVNRHLNDLVSEDGVNLGARERYFLLIAPLSVGVSYKLKYFNNQIVVPYMLAGGDLFNILEFRDDGARPNILVAPAYHFGFGLNFLIDRLSGRMNRLEKEYGINHMYIVAEMRQYLSVTNSVNLTNTLFLVGVSAEY